MLKKNTECTSEKLLSYYAKFHPKHIFAFYGPVSVRCDKVILFYYVLFLILNIIVSANSRGVRLVFGLDCNENSRPIKL